MLAIIITDIIFSAHTILFGNFANQNALGDLFRTPAPIPTNTLTPTNTATFTPTATNTATPTPTLTNTPTFTPSPTETPTWGELDDDGDGVLNYADNCPQKYAETSNGCPQNNGGGSDGGGFPGGGGGH